MYKKMSPTSIKMFRIPRRRAVHFQESILAQIYFVGSGLCAFAIDSSCTQECVIVKTCHIMTMHDQFMGTNKI